MQIILADYDGGYYNECLIGKRRFTQHPLIGFICTYVEEGEYKTAYDALLKLLDEYGIEEDSCFYDLICADNGAISHITFNENLYNRKIINYAFVTFEGDINKGAFEYDLLCVPN